MRRPALVPLAVAGTALALALSAAAPGLADDTASPAATTSAAPADPTAPVVATTSTETTTVVTEASATPTAGTPTASPTPQVGGNGAFSYPFVLTSGEGGASTVAIEVAGTGISLGYTLDEQGKVTDAVVAAGTATLVSSTPHTVKLLLEDGTTVMVKVHGDAVRVKVKPRKGGPLRPGIVTTEQAAADAEAAEAAEVEATEAPEAEETAGPGKGKGKGKGAEKSKAAKDKPAKGKGKKQG